MVAWANGGYPLNQLKKDNKISKSLKSADINESDNDGRWYVDIPSYFYGFMGGAIYGAVTGAISSGAQVTKAASYWDKGTFKSGYQSMKYHYREQVVNKGLTK